jgi:hypothetical protein
VGARFSGAAMSRKVSDLLNEQPRAFSPLQQLLHRAGNQEAWTAQLRALLPGNLAQDCRVVDVRGPLVELVCSNAATATRLRFMAPDLLVELRRLSDFRAAEKLQIRVSPT